MKPFIHDDFMLQNDLAKHLYHSYVKDLPIIDYHCHLDPKNIYQNQNFSSLGAVWLGHDHYKWRLMRAYGVQESYVTGPACFEDKLRAYAEMLPELFGNPILHWSQLELKRYFNVESLLSLDNVDEIEEKANTLLRQLKPTDIFDQFKVEFIGTTDDPTDSLEWHQRIKADNKFKTNVSPTFRPDRAVNIEQTLFLSWLSKLSDLYGNDIKSLDMLKEALIQRLDFFNENGCLMSDHSLEAFVFCEANANDVDRIFKKRLDSEALSANEIAQYKSYMMTFFGEAYHERSMVQQYHIGAYRNTNVLQFEKLGADMGYDALLDQPVITPIKGLLNSLAKTNSLPKTILYSVNPNDYEPLIPLMQSFQSDIKGKIQLGSAWWFQDNIDGMRRQMRALMSNGIFSIFIGMLTDSRSYLSYPRHEYFRRLLCQVVSEEVLNGYYPNDEILLKKLVQNISYYNAKDYFNLL